MQAMQRLSYDQDCGCGNTFRRSERVYHFVERDTCSECRQTAYDEAQLEKRNGKWQYVLVQHIADGEIESL